MKQAEQISRCRYTGHSPRAKRILKWLVKRARRRAEKRDPENAPRKQKAFIWGQS